MAYYAVAFGLALHALLWGAGLAALITPTSWRRFWPVFCPPVGLALQSAIVWAGALSGLAGTDVYGRWSEVVPLLLAVLAIRRHGLAGLWADLSRWRALGCLTALSIGALILPMALASPLLTTSSLGSCDAADYAAGARVFQEFARADRGGFMGLTEVVKVASADTFFDFWLRLNHFTPSALIALNGSILGLAPHQLAGVLTAVLLALSLPAVFWMSRAVLRYPSGVSLWIAAIYGLSPLTWYAVAHVAIGQLLAAQAIALITWVGVALWQGPLTRRRAVSMGGILLVAYWLVLGSYNFVILVCLVPAAAFACGQALREAAWRRLAQWWLAMLVPLAVCSAVFPGRVRGLAERFALFRQFDFGWRIPVLSPEGWLGAVAGTGLGGYAIGLRVALAVALVALLALAVARGAASRPRVAWIAICMVLPILAGYGFLEFRGATAGTNASYDAYKLFAVFYPGLLCGLCFWTTLLRGTNRSTRLAAVAAVVLVTGLNTAVACKFAFAMRRPPLSVGTELAQLQEIESMPDIASVNMRIPDMWTRLWANAFLLRKPQYFATHTYEGRLNTPLRGQWDLNGGIIQLRLPGDATRRINGEFSLSDTRSPSFVRVEEGSGWFDLERLSRGATERWRWTDAGKMPELRFENPQARPLRATVALKEVRSFERRRSVLVKFDGSTAYGKIIGTEWGTMQGPEFTLPSGATTLRFETDVSLLGGNVRNTGDSRQLGFQVSGIEVEIR